MTDLPTGWAWATLENLLAVEKRPITDGPFGSKLATRHYTASGARVIRLQNIGDGVFRDEEVFISDEYFEQLRDHEVRPGDLVIASLGEKLPRACIVPDLGAPAIVKADCIRARIHPGVDVRWVLYALMAPETREWASSRIKGVGRPRLGMVGIRQIPLPVPPLVEQRRIIAVLEDRLSGIEDGVEQVAKVIQRIDRFRDALMTAVCTGKLAADSAPGLIAAKPPPANSVDGDLPSIPSHWSWARLGEIAEVVGGVTKDSKKQSDTTLPEVPYLRVANVQRGRLDLTNVARIRVPSQKAKQLELKFGDVLLNEGGDRDKLGRGWIWESQIPGCIHQNHVFRARVLDDVLDPKLLAWHTNSFGKRWCEVNGKQSINLASISLSKIKLLPVPVPPADEQGQMVAEAEQYLTLLDSAEQAARASISRAHNLRRSLLAEAFAGRLVEQDSTDEPASVLLERIDAERAARALELRPRRGKGEKAPQKETLL
ncbi:restriction endonuclease subunit S [Spirillospora sp. NPDC048832]